VKLIAPILPHTADEVWNFIPGVDVESVQLTDMPEANAKHLSFSEEALSKWDAFLEIRDEVLKAMEEARRNKVFGNSVDAKLALYPQNDHVAQTLAAMDDLADLFIVAHVDLHSQGTAAPAEAVQLEGISTIVAAADGVKCERCRVVKQDVGTHSAHPAICGRCATVVEEHYAHVSEE
jgi:isoleucyl-tRNA synthetase